MVAPHFPPSHRIPVFLINFADHPGASLGTNLSAALARIARSTMQGWSLGSLSRGGVVTLDCKAWVPGVLSEGRPQASSSSNLLL